MGERIVQIQEIERFHWHLSESECPVSFSADGNRLSLAAALELASIATQKRIMPPARSSGIRVERNSVWGLIKESRWPSRTGAVKLRDGDVALVVLPIRNDAPSWTRCIRELQSDLSTSGFSANLANGLTGAVIEMVDNVWLHGETTTPGLLAYQIRRRKFAFGVIDTGIGILASLRKNPRYNHLSSSMEAVGRAIEPGVSSDPSGGGMGFPSLFHSLASLWGTARIRSGEAALLIDHTQEKRSKSSLYLPHLPGTHISVRCALDPPARQRS